MTDRRWGMSTHLFHEERLSRDHLVHIAAHGFELIEVFATRGHFDYTDPAAIDALAEWLVDTRLELHSMHAPAFEALRAGQWVNPFSNASASEERRKAAVAATAATLDVGARLPFHYLVAHVGVPDGVAGAGDNHPDAARRSVQDICALAGERGIRVALEVMPNKLSSATALAALLEDEIDGMDAGVCLDYGHAHMMGDLGDAIETLAGHLWATHVHDNHGRSDEHLVPFAGNIDWDAAIMETQKVGYEGALMFEVSGGGDPVDVLRRAAKARERLEKAFVTFEIF